MKRLPVLPELVLPCFGTAIVALTSVPAWAESPLSVVYPPANHETTADRIFLIGTAPPTGPVTVNGQVIPRSAAGHFAPSFPLQMGANQFTLRYGSQELQLTVTRQSTAPVLPTGVAFLKESLTPAANVARPANEWVCFSAIAPANATVTATLANQTIPLQPQAPRAELPPNSAVLVGQNQPTVRSSASTYTGCTRTLPVGDLGQPVLELRQAGQTVRQTAPGRVTILSPNAIEVAEVTAKAGVARTGPSTDFSRLTPLPQGTLARVVVAEGDWVQLDYGAWIRRSEVEVRSAGALPTSIIRSVKAREMAGATEFVFPLEVPVPASLHQSDRTVTLTLYNTVAQSDTIQLNDNPYIRRLDWQQVTPEQLQYTFHLKSEQQWGYELAYQGTSLVLTLRHPPQMAPNAAQPLAGLTIVLDPGHGGPEDLGSRGPTGYPEKDVNLRVSKLLQEELVQRGARVVMTRTEDVDLGLQERMDVIQQTRPAIALSLHYNALPDNGDALRTQGVGAFWYHPQAHSLAVFLHNYLTRTLKRPSYGVFWNNLALTRPAVAPSVLLELGFMINPTEFEWVINPAEQQRLAMALADGIVAWFQQTRP